jgi:integrase
MRLIVPPAVGQSFCVESSTRELCSRKAAIWIIAYAQFPSAMSFVDHGGSCSCRRADIDFSASTMNVTRSIVHGNVGPCKTESSQKPVPMHPQVREVLIMWREQSKYRRLDDWVFASSRSRGKSPYWGQTILQKHLRPAAKELGIEKCFGWHAFRHTYSTPLRSVGTEFKVMQELLRYSTTRSTLDVYTQAITPDKQNAQAAVMSLVFASDD